MNINGASRLYVIIGDPIAQVRSPEVFSERFVAAGLNAVMIPVHVPTDRFDSIIPALFDIANLDGVLVTVPFKGRMLAFAGTIGASARAVGAVNALRREPDGSWSADIFDGVGFVRGVERKGGQVRGSRVVLFGAGGAGSAIACALAQSGAQSIEVIDEVSGKARSLVERIVIHFPGCSAKVGTGFGPGFDMLVNASPVGMRAGDGLPGKIEHLSASTFVGDVVIRESPTALIQLAMDRGCQWTQGQDMLAGQVDSLLEFFGVATRTISTSTQSIERRN